MNWKIQLTIGIIAAAIAGYSVFMLIAGSSDTEVVKTYKLNELTGEYEPRYYESNPNTFWMIPFILCMVIGIVGIVSGLIERMD